MGKHKVKSKYRVGNTIYLDVEREHIDDSDPCNKDNCMLTRAIVAWLIANYGEKNFKVKSTNHGVIFELNDRRYVGVFDHKTAFRIYNYDQVFRSTRSKERARETVRPFKARLMIESSVAVTKFPPMSEETKTLLRKYHSEGGTATGAKASKRGGRGIAHIPRRSGVRRELSL